MLEIFKKKCPETTGGSKGQARLLRQNKKLHHGDGSCVLKNSIWKVDKRAAIHNIKCWNRPKKEKVHAYCRNVLKHNYHIRMCFTQLDHNSNKQDIFSVDIFQQKGVTFCKPLCNPAWIFIHLSTQLSLKSFVFYCSVLIFYQIKFHINKPTTVCCCLLTSRAVKLHSKVLYTQK